MGFDLRAIPVRLESEPIRRLLSDAKDFEDTVCFPPFTDQTWGEELPELNRALCAAHPGLSGWDKPYPDRSYEAAEFVLDPTSWRTGRNWKTRQRTLAFRIICGDRQLADHATGGQGVHWRGSHAAFLRHAADAIDRLDPVTARRDFSVPELEELAVYKVSAHDVEDELFGRVLGNLAGLARYYRNVADRGLDLIIQND